MRKKFYTRNVGVLLSEETYQALIRISLRNLMKYYRLKKIIISVASIKIKNPSSYRMV
jgi:hypothetical protein